MLKQEHSVTVDELGITFEAGTLAKQANGAVTVQLGETIVFIAATAASELRSPDQDFFSLDRRLQRKIFCGRAISWRIF